MFIEQLKNRKPNLWLYLPFPVLFIGLMIWNYIESEGIDTNEMIQQYIEIIGVNGTFLALIAPLSIACMVLLFWVKYIQNQSITILTTSRKKIDWKRIFFSFSLWSIISITMVLGSYFLSPESFVFNFRMDKFLVFLVIAILFIPLQTSFEEYLFRGHMMQGIGLATNNRIIPLVITSVLFGLMHIANPEVGKIGYIIMAYYIGTGFFLGIITLMDEGLELALGFHAANNLIGALLVTADWTAFQTHSIFKDISEPTAGFDIILPVFIIFPILILIFAKKYKWNNWLKKLTGNLNTENVTENNNI
ncbi:CPBP family intramembrane glutamic endopeptidase [Flavobacterium sp.]|jgi:membrane protease YdiL (CAAX protease family)|uniref:CPBP family intramembrane glutamic endopeptidase n=1 Tax=Flavobacterium sp. TaxID=239 RepID=UPI002A821620|nr:CPBP family intramembrane glutamic endopeptidase [Flavobacterium sp.]